MKKFDNLYLLGRPASGKSEFIDFVKSFDSKERLERLHIAEFEEIDDFPWIWEKFMDDDIWEAAGYKRKYSKEYMPNNPGLNAEAALLLDFCIEKFNREIKTRYLNDLDFYKKKTLIIEFARGGSRTYKESLNKIDRELWENAAILYVDVTAEESWRRNVARYEENQRHSILAHMVPKETYDMHFRQTDWYDFSGNRSEGYIELHGIKVPFVNMNNAPELPPGPEIAARYKEALDKLNKLYMSTIYS